MAKKWSEPKGEPPIKNVMNAHLEGPKKNHDNHGPNASVPAKGNNRAIPGQHWEKHYDLCAPSKNMYLTEGADFAPKRSAERKTTYLKVNREDH
jgi:hypothetical protein